VSFDDSAFARLKARNEEMRRRQMTEPREWPPESNERSTTVYRGEAHGLQVAVRVIHMNGTSLPDFFAAYVHVPAGHPDDGRWYDEIPARCNGGLTFMCRAKGGGTWFGWDYGHYGDEDLGHSRESVIEEAGEVAAWFAARAGQAVRP